MNVDKNLYTYQMRLMDSCRHFSGYSNIAQAVLLTQDTSAQFPTLFWTEYKNWKQGVASYQVKIYDDKADSLVLVAENPSTDTDFRDNQTNLDQQFYCYCIESTAK